LKYITKENFSSFIHNQKVVFKRLSKYEINPAHFWCNTKSESVYCFENNIINSPKCECGKNLSYRSRSVGYSTFCSRKCANSNNEVIQKQINAKDWKLMSDKLKITLSKRSSEDIIAIQEKQKDTKLLKYGDENYNNRSQAKKTMNERYGVDYAMQCPDKLAKTIKTQNEMYGGVFHPEKVKQTNLRKYGVEYPLQNSIQAKKFSKILRNKYNGSKYGKGVVYVLFFPIINLVKIGVTANFQKRKKGLINDFGDFDIISIIEYDDAYQKERNLHKKYDKYNVVLNEGAGKTEFFLPDIMKDF